MKFIHQIAFICLILRGLVACQHAPNIVVEPTIQEQPDTCGVKNVSYKNKIDAIMTKHCKECHSGRGALKGINLESYQSTKLWFQSDTARMLGVIRFEAGTGIYMPPVGQIPECEIRQLETWVRQGYKAE